MLKAERVDVVWAEFVTTSVDYLPTSTLNSEGIGGCSAEWAWGENCEGGIDFPRNFC